MEDCERDGLPVRGPFWGRGWRSYLFPAFWLIYLGQTASGVAKYSHGGAAVLGYVLIVAFAAVYLAALPMTWNGRTRLFWVLYALAVALTGIETLFARSDALVCAVYVAVLTVASQWRLAPAAVLALTGTVVVLPRFVPGWGGQLAWDLGLSVVLVAVGMYGFFTIVRSNIALAAARAEVARLAAENERSRIARDLHDLLGHSLTTITVKAGLARRLAEHGEGARATAEIAEVEQLSRRTLGDVRAAVSAHHEVTLAGELATGREVLRAAGIVAELPESVAEVRPELSELFGWVVREGLTNVVRHSRAEHVRIGLGADWMEIRDDGRDEGRGDAARAGSGHGLTGLSRRCGEQGAELSYGGGSRGFTLRVEAGSRPSAATPPADAPQHALRP